MLDKQNLNNVLFLDIETAPITFEYSDLDKKTKDLWDTKFQYLKDSTPKDQYKKAGLYAEFSKVICISVGFFNDGTFRIKSFYNKNEKVLLENFTDLLKKHYNRKEHLLCAHNGKEFDFPFLSRRMLINGVKLPKILNLTGKKPWEIMHLDTMEIWKFGDYKSYISLNLLANVFNIPTPKDDIQGSDVGRIYWIEKDIKRIVTYCQKDVITIAQLILKFKGERTIETKKIVYI